MKSGIRVRQRVKVFSRINIMGCQRVIHLIAAGSKNLFMKNDREVSIIRLHFRLNLVQLKALNTFQMVSIACCHRLSFRNLIMNMSQVAKAHCGAEFVHLGVCPDSTDFFGSVNAKILQIIQCVPNLFVTESNRAAFDCIENLRCVEGEAGRIAKATHASSFIGLSEGVTRVIDYFQSVFVGEPLYPFDVADVPIYMHGKDRASPLCDQTLQLPSIHSERHGIDVTEDRLQTVANDGVRGRSEGERRREHFSMQIHRLERQLNGHMAICEEFHILHAHEVEERLLQLYVLGPHIGKPMGIPHFLDFIDIFIQFGHR